MEFQTRRWVRPEDLNPYNTLFAGRLMEWVNEQIGLSTVIQLKNRKFAARHISDIHFMTPARLGDVVEIGIEVVEYGKTSITFRGDARNYLTQDPVLSIEKIIMVCLDEDGKPLAHGLRK